MKNKILFWINVFFLFIKDVIFNEEVKVCSGVIFIYGCFLILIIILFFFVILFL